MSTGCQMYYKPKNQAANGLPAGASQTQTFGTDAPRQNPCPCTYSPKTPMPSSCLSPSRLIQPIGVNRGKKNPNAQETRRGGVVASIVVVGPLLVVVVVPRHQVHCSLCCDTRSCRDQGRNSACRSQGAGPQRLQFLAPQLQPPTLLAGRTGRRMRPAGVKKRLVERALGWWGALQECSMQNALL